MQAGTGNRAGTVSFSTTAGPPTFNIANVTCPNKITFICPPPYAGGLVGGLTPGGATTGDALSPLLGVRQADGSWPHHVHIELTVLRPDAGIGNLLSDAGLGAGVVLAGDDTPPRQATLQAIEQTTGKPAIQYVEEHFTLEEDAANTRGSFEASGSAGIALPDFLRLEGTYTFHAKATYGECGGTRALVWTVQVDVGIDAGRTDVKTDPLDTWPDGHECWRMTFTPRDKYGNRLGPGRASDLEISARPGSTLTSPVLDLGHGA